MPMRSARQALERRPGIERDVDGNAVDRQEVLALLHPGEVEG